MAGSIGIDIGWVEAFFARLESNANKVAQEAGKEAIRTLMPEIRNAFEEAYKQCASEWYGGYSPIYYPRNESLKDAFQITVCDSENGKLEWVFINEFTDAFHTVFALGYHGGAPHDGGYFWRAPIPYFTHWGREATQNVSILFTFSQKVNELEAKYRQELSALAQQIFNKNAGSIYSMSL